MSAKGLFDTEKTIETKAIARKQFKNGPEMASSHPACSGHIQNGSKCPDSMTCYLFASKQPPK